MNGATAQKKTVRERGPRSTAPPTLFYTAVVSCEGGVEVSLNGRGEKSGRRNFPFEEKKVSHPSTLLPVQVFFLLEYRLIPPFAPCLVPFMFFCCPLLTAKRKKARFFSARDWCLGRQPTIPYGAVLYIVLLGETYWREPSSLAWNGSGGVFAL